MGCSTFSEYTVVADISCAKVVVGVTVGGAGGKTPLGSWNFVLKINCWMFEGRCVLSVDCFKH